jgi:hypothetical protein
VWDWRCGCWAELRTLHLTGNCIFEGGVTVTQLANVSSIIIIIIIIVIIIIVVIVIIIIIIIFEGGVTVTQLANVRSPRAVPLSSSASWSPSSLGDHFLQRGDRVWDEG